MSSANGPRLTVVVGGRRSEGSVDRCLSALAQQKTDGVRVVLVEDEQDGGHPAADLVIVRPGGLVPELWTEGLRHVDSPIVALTATAVIPDDGWVDAILERHAAGIAGVGGPIEPDRYRRLTDWAVYFCRYARYMLPVTDPSLDPAGDNVSYRTEILARYQPVYAQGFWEPFVHTAMRDDGERLEMRSAGVVRAASGVRLGSFSRQRLRHGRAHGRSVSAVESGGRTVLRCLAAPAVPAVMTWRAARTVVATGRHQVALAACAPVLVWLYTCWAAGELLGRIDRLSGRHAV